MKYLLLGLLAYVAWRWYVAQKPGNEPGNQPAAQASPPPADDIEKMVSCAQCGIHLPQSEAIAGPGARHFCCSEHQQEHARRSS